MAPDHAMTRDETKMTATSLTGDAGHAPGRGGARASAYGSMTTVMPSSTQS